MSFTDSSSAARKQDEGKKRRSRKHGKRGRSDTTGSEKSTLSRSIATFNPFQKPDKKVKPPKSTCRLGRTELGPYAWEDRMPRWLHDQLAAGPEITTVNRIGRDGRLIKQETVQNETPGIIPILAQLSALDRSVREAFYCHPSTLHIGKTPREGGFCGYRNIQMLISYIQGAKAQGVEDFPGRTPGVLKLQDLIERAWDKGINEIGRQQTGGIRDTRKYIGTPEAHALFLSSEIDCAVEMFNDSRDGSVEAHEALLTAVESYFSQAATDDGSNVYKTLLPPIYLQQPGHSITIVGLERRLDGLRNLIVFDPTYSTSPAMHRLIGRKNIKTPRPEVLWGYRRISNQLKKYASFEVLLLTAHPPLFPAWDVLRQFPDCRYLYVFFRSRTLGYDVYPEDHFLLGFPWQQYGGLWIIDDARFARSERMDSHTAQALRRITGEGTYGGVSSLSDSFQKCTRISSHQPAEGNLHVHQPAAHGMSSNYAVDRFSLPPSLDNSAAAIVGSYFDAEGLETRLSVLNSELVCAQSALADAFHAQQQMNLAKLTDVGRRYPGYPTPLSPTLNAKQYFPSPTSEFGSDGMSPCNIGSPAARASSPRSVDGPGSPPFNLTLSPTSPRAVMLKNIASKQALQGLLHQHKSTANDAGFCGLPTPPASPTSAGLSLPRIDTNVPAISIAKGTEICTPSPISPHGTILSYTSNRSADSGLLAVPPLSEAQVAEYRFWRPCGRGRCSFGCGAGQEGEWTAARRLFKSVEEVAEEIEEMEQESAIRVGECGLGNDDHGTGGLAEVRQEIRKPRLGTGSLGIDVWLRERERDGVCDV